MASGARQVGHWQKISRVIAAITAFIVGAGALATALVKLGAAYPALLPFWAPFDATISLRDIRVEKPSPSTSTFNDGPIEDAVNVNITYVEEKKGRSTLRQWDRWRMVGRDGSGRGAGTSCGAPWLRDGI